MRVFLPPTLFLVCAAAGSFDIVLLEHPSLLNMLNIIDLGDMGDVVVSR